MQIALARIHAMFDIKTGRICVMTAQRSNDIVPQNGLLAKPTCYNPMPFLFSCTSGVAVNAIRSYLTCYEKETTATYNIREQGFIMEPK